MKKIFFAVMCLVLILSIPSVMMGGDKDDESDEEGISGKGDIVRTLKKERISPRAQQPQGRKLLPIPLADPAMMREIGVPLDRVKSVAAGDNFSLALDRRGIVYIWGMNVFGIAGAPLVIERAIPVPGLTDIQSLCAGGIHAAFIKNDGTVLANDNWSMPEPVPDLRNVAKVACGTNHTLAIVRVTDQNGHENRPIKVWAWGRNDRGQLGDGTTNHSLIPVESTEEFDYLGLDRRDDLIRIEDVAAGASHSMLLLSTGHVYVWGSNEYGQLGQSPASLPQSLRPILLPDRRYGQHASGIAAGYWHSLIKYDDYLVGFGMNQDGQLGLLKTSEWNYEWRPTRIPGSDDVKNFAGGEVQTLIRKWDGTYLVINRAAGDSSNLSALPAGYPSLISLPSMAGGGFHQLVLDGDGRVWAWGSNHYGEIGHGLIGSYVSRPGTVFRQN